MELIDPLLAPYRAALEGRSAPEDDPIDSLQQMLLRLALGSGGGGSGLGSLIWNGTPPNFVNPIWDGTPPTFQPLGVSTYTGPTSFTPVRSGHYPIVDPTPELLPNPHEVAPEIQRTWDELQARWPSTTNMGTHVVRNIAGTNTLSQHSFGDAIDIGGSPGQLEDEANWLRRKADELGLTELIYQTSIWTPSEGWHPYSGIPHTNHIHITGPQTYGDTSPYFPTVKWSPRTNPAQQPNAPVPVSSVPRKVKISAYKARAGGHRV